MGQAVQRLQAGFRRAPGEDLSPDLNCLHAAEESEWRRDHQPYAAAGIIRHGLLTDLAMYARPFGNAVADRTFCPNAASLSDLDRKMLEAIMIQLPISPDPAYDYQQYGACTVPPPLTQPSD